MSSGRKLVSQIIPDTDAAGFERALEDLMGANSMLLEFAKAAKLGRDILAEQLGTDAAELQSVPTALSVGPKAADLD